MSEIPFNLLLGALVFLLFPLAGGLLASKYKISPVIGYILGGILLHLFFSKSLPKEFINNFSIAGLVLLVFTLGLETNFTIIKRFGRFVLWGGFIQLMISAILIYLLSLLFGFNSLEAIIFGFAFALSSTAVVAKIIQERGEESSLLGGLAIGILIFQDLAFIPVIIILSSFGQAGSFVNLLQNVLVNSLKAVLVLTLVYYVGHKLVPWLFNRIAKTSREVFNLFVIVFILLTLSFFSLFDISILLAAFIAGILLGQTFEHHHIFSQIRPFRDLLAVVFFVYLGLTIDPGFVIGHIIPILGFVLAVILLKATVLLAIYLFFRFHTRIAFALAAYLFQIGEYAFIILLQAERNRSVRSDSFHFALGVVLLTLLATPFVIRSNDKIYAQIRKFIKKRLSFLENFIAYNLDRETPNIDVLALKNHVVICGYGRIGSYIGRALTLANIPFIALDYNLHVVEKAKKEGVNIIYGDPTEIDVLDYAECDRASILVSAVPNIYSQETIIFNGKKLNSKLVILSRVHRDEDRHMIKDLGAEVVVQPEFEASLSIIRRVLLWKGLDREEIARKIKRLKIEHGMI